MIKFAAVVAVMFCAVLLPWAIHVAFDRPGHDRPEAMDVVGVVVVVAIMVAALGYIIWGPTV